MVDADEFELDEAGRPRRKRVLRHGDTVHYNMTMMDAFFGGDARSPADSGGDTACTQDDGATRVVDARGDLAGHRPGYLLTADTAVSRQEANAAYEQRKQDVAARWRKNRRRKKLAPQPQAPSWLAKRHKGGAYPIKPVSGDGYDDEDDVFDSDELSGLTLDELKLRAERARADREERLANGPWREGRR